jgi:hypothetical protein
MQRESVLSGDPANDIVQDDSMDIGAAKVTESSREIKRADWGNGVVQSSISSSGKQDSPSIVIDHGTPQHFEVGNFRSEQKQIRKREFADN